MSIELVGAVLNASGLSSPQRAVMVVLAYHANAAGEAWPAVSTIMRKTSLGERTVRRALGELREAGWFWADEQRGTSSRYTLRLARLLTPATAAPLPVRPKPLPERQGTPATAAPNKSVNRQKKITTPRATSPHLLPADWQHQPFGDKTACARIIGGWTADGLEHELERFRAYHEANATTFSDWQAAWKTWVLNSDRFRSERYDGSNRHTGRVRGAGRTERDTRDGLDRALDRRLGIEPLAGEAGRCVAGEGDGDRGGAPPALRLVKS